METRARKFSSSIDKWYLQNGRKNLPWRKNTTPYRVWISEIMLQQTQVKTVIPFYKKFTLRFPNLKAISEATEEEILALWTGLGFYRRAKNIYATKEIIKNKYKNKFPSNFDDLIKLPGIGKSTAGAILSIAYKKPVPILDANVKRVISRHDDIDLQDKKSLASLWHMSETYTPSKKIFEYTQGIMDLGAIICTVKNPMCSDCPLTSSCKTAFKDLKIVNRSKRQKRKEKLFFTLAHSKNEFLLFRKNAKTYWESLWIPYEDKDGLSNTIFKEPTQSNTKKFKHALSHLDLDITINIFDYKAPFAIETNLEHQWIKKSDIHKYGLPRPIKNIIDSHV